MGYEFDFSFLWNYGPLIVEGLLGTLIISTVATAIGMVIGVGGAAMRLYAGHFLSSLVGFYVEIVRNTPFLVQLFLFYFGLPLVGLRLDANTSAVVAMAFNVGAYSIEIIRAGLVSIPQGQIEAGAALGLSGYQIFRDVMLLPALRGVYPSLTSQFILVMLTSSVVSVVSATDLTAAANDIASLTFHSFEIYVVITLIYLLMTMVFVLLFDVIERHLFRFAH
jgi:polar amino acid transport system permease protein